MNSIRFALMVVAVLLSACTTVGKDVAANLQEVPQNKGVALFSTGSANMSIAFPVSLRLVNGSNQKWYDKVVISFIYPSESHFKESYGRVRSLTLPPGKYHLMPWAGNPYFQTTGSPLFTFEVTEDKVTYIGSFFFQDGKTSLQQSNTARDLNYFLEKNPKFNLTDIDVKFAKGDGYLTAPSSFLKGIIWDAPQ